MARKKRVRLEDPAPTSGEGASTTDAEPALRQVSRRSLRGKRGGLKDMPNMPMDILLEIFGHLEPRDLLNLARTSKDFRKYLMSRKSAFLWKAARQNIAGLPDCPPYLSELAYANLVFFPYCHECLKGNIQPILWEFRARYCNACKKLKTCDCYYAIDLELPKHLQSTARLSDLLVYQNGPRRVLYHKPDVDELRASLRALVGKPDEEKKYVEARVAFVKQISDHTAKCSEWHREKSWTRSTELENTRNERFDAIVDNLQKLGWAEELEILHADGYWRLKQHAHVRISKPLTKRGWQKICGELVAFMEEVKSDRVCEERRRLLVRRLSSLSEVISDYYSESLRTEATDLKPQFVDFAFMPEFRDLADAPNATNVTVETFRALRPQIPTLIERWQSEAKAELTAIITKEIEVPENVDALDLAVAFFDCKCGRTLRYPAIVAHKCLHPSYASFLDPPTAELYSKVACQLGGRTRKWSSTVARFPRALVRLKSILQTMGLSIDQTAHEADDRDMRLVHSPPDSPYIRKVMTWRKAVDYLPTSNCLTWELASEAERTKAKQMEGVRSIDQRHKEKWCCALCSLRDGRYKTFAGIQEHHRTAHQENDTSVENGNVYIHLDGSPSELVPIWFFSDHLTREKLSWTEELRFTTGVACFFPFPPKSQ